MNIIEIKDILSLDILNFIKQNKDKIILNDYDNKTQLLLKGKLFNMINKRVFDGDLDLFVNFIKKEFDIKSNNDDIFSIFMSYNKVFKNDKIYNLIYVKIKNYLNYKKMINNTNPFVTNINKKELRYKKEKLEKEIIIYLSYYLFNFQGFNIKNKYIYNNKVAFLNLFNN